MKYEKKVCQSLKVVRKQIADANEIAYEITECPHQGDCPGTCPKCESELRYIENQLNIRRAAGKAISLVGLSLGISTAFAINGEAMTIPQDSITNQTDKEDVLMGIVEQQPAFRGGETALMEFIKNNLRFPEELQETYRQERVILSFNIEKDGSITDIEVMRSPHEAMSNEAIRVVKLMPKWQPGKLRGKATRTKYVLPISFRLK